MTIKETVITISIFLIIAYNKFYSQELSWKNYTSTESIKAMLIDGDALWIGEIGPTASLVKMNLSSHSLTFYNIITAGLPDNNFYAIVKEENGILWFGSTKGLIKYENDAFHLFNPSNSPLPDTMVTAILVDNEQNKWIGTFRGGSFGVGDLGGLAKFYNSQWLVYRMDNSPLPNNNITAITQQNNGAIWVGTVNGLVRIYNNTWTVFTVLNSGLLSNTILSLAVDGQDNIWIGTSDGISKYVNGNWTNYTFGAPGSIENQILCLKYANNKIFVGLYNGLKSFDGTEWKNYLTPFDHAVKAMDLDGNANLWVGTNFRLGKLTWESNYDSLDVFNIGNSELPSNYVNQIAFDSAGNKWICTSYGFAKFDGESWIIYDNKNLPLNELEIGSSAIAIEEFNNIWIGTRSGKLIHLINGDVEIFDSTNSPLKYPITSLIIDKNNKKWIGTVIGIHTLLGTDWTTYNSNNSPLSNDFINNLAVSKTNDIYIATYEGVFIYCNNCNDPWSRLLPEPIGSLGNQIESIAIDSTDNIWLGTFGAGLYKYDMGSLIWTNYHTNNSQIPDNNIHSITVDKNNNKWLATGISPNQGGISRFDGNEFTNFNTSNSPLLYNIISFIGIDKEDNKWICANGGGLTLLDDNLSDIEIDPPPSPTDFYLSQNYPNPFNPSTRINFIIPEAGMVSIRIYDVLGNEVKGLLHEWKSAGSHEVNFDTGRLVSGIYFYTLQWGDKFKTRKMILLK